MSHSPLLLITGGAGGVATALRPELRAAGLRLRLFDRAPVPAPVAGQEEAVLGSLADGTALAAAMQGAQGVLHLAGCTTDAGWESQVADSMLGSIQLFEAARAAGVPRVIYASSNHVVGMYPRARRITEQALPRPDSRYGVAKAFGESLGAFFADKYGLGVLCIRIGNVADRPVDRRRLSIWISPRDLAQLVLIGLRHPALGFRVVYGVSGNARSFYEATEAHALGYRPADEAEPHAARILAEDPPPAGPADAGEVAQGGSFAAAEFVGDPARLLR